MRIFAMNKHIALMKTQSKEEIKYLNALSDLLQIGTFTNSLTRLKRLVVWIERYACNEDFQIKVKDTQKVFLSDEPDLLERIFPNLFSESKEFKSFLSKKGIEYIDSDFTNSDSNRFAVSVCEVCRCLKQLETIAELYEFIMGESISITPVAYNGKPLFPSEFASVFEDFLSFKELEQTKNFLISEDDCEAFGISELDERDYEILSTCEITENDFDEAYRDHFEQETNFEVTDSLTITRYDPFGHDYYLLAIEIVCKYLEKCSSYANFYNLKTCPFVFCERTSEFKKIEAENTNREIAGKLNGFYKLHSTLADCILENRISKCENCKKAFIAKRNDAKTCSQKCRNELAMKKRIIDREKEDRVILTRTHSGDKS